MKDRLGTGGASALRTLGLGELWRFFSLTVIGLTTRQILMFIVNRDIECCALSILLRPLSCTPPFTPLKQALLLPGLRISPLTDDIPHRRLV